jgi:hypothetical protein
MHISDPDSLSDEKWAQEYAILKYIRKEEDERQARLLGGK